jgi:DNA-binding GntR family transcriptional regulator
MRHDGLSDSSGRDQQSVSQLVYRQLRDQILWGAIPPGTRLSLRTLAAQLGVSSMPVRDALHRLAIEELVEVRPRSATRVAAISIERITEMFEVRTHLESLAGRLATAHLTRADIRRLKTCQERLENASARGGAEDWHQWNQEFHLLIFRKCGNALLQRMTQGLWDRNLRLFTARVVTQAAFRNRRSAEHRRILAALEQRDADAVEAAYRHHMTRSGAETVSYMHVLMSNTLPHEPKGTTGDTKRAPNKAHSARRAGRHSAAKRETKGR